MHVLLVLLLVACGSADVVPANATSQPPERVEDVAMRLGRAGLTGDRATALSLTLSFEELSRLSSKAAERSKQEWDDEVDHFFDGLAREGTEGEPITVVGAKVVKAGQLTKGKDSKVLRDIEFAVVQLVIEQGSGEAAPGGVPLIFFKTDAGWRFSPRP